MIIQALARYYDILAKDGKINIARYGYGTANVSFALVLSAQGELLELVPLFQTVPRGKKTVEMPLPVIAPEHKKRSGIHPPPYFLCDNPAYVLGLAGDNQDDPEKAQAKAEARFASFREENLKLLARSGCVESRAVAAFLTRYDRRSLVEHPVIQENLEGLLKAKDLVFKLDQTDGFVHEHPEIQRVWEDAVVSDGSAVIGQCLASGEIGPLARLHPNFQGVRGANSAGATLVGFNNRAYESYALKQGMNAPTGEKTVFKYGEALRYLLSRESEFPKFYIGDSTVVYWAESPNKAYADLFSILVDPDWSSADIESRRDPAAGRRLVDIAQKVKRGEPLDISGLMEGLDRKTQFYVLGLAPNVSRLAIRFFHRDPFEKLIRKIMSHYDDLRIDREYETQPGRIPIRYLLDELVAKKSRNKETPPLMAGAVMRAVLTGAPYPAAMYYAVINRIRADSDDPKAGIRKINTTRAAIIKAYLTRKYRNQPDSPIQEVLSMSLNEQSTYPAYLLGRLFAVLEKAQEDAIPNINATIKDRYFSSACASPVTAFPNLMRLSQHHLAKMEKGRKIWYEKLFGQIMAQMDIDQNPFPSRLSLDDQGAFMLGYYQQRSAFFKPKANQNTEPA